MVKFAFVVATSPKLPRPSLCEGGVYCDDAATRGDDDYSDNDIRRAHLDATRYNVDYAKFGGTYEVRDSLEGVDVSDPDVLESLVAWQLAAVSAAVRDHDAYKAGRAAWSSNVTKGDNPYHRADSENRTLWNLGWQDACDEEVTSLDALPAVVDDIGDYVTRDGRRVTVYEVAPVRVADAAEFRVKGSLFTERPGQRTSRTYQIWHVSGRYMPLKESSADIVGRWSDGVSLDKPEPAPKPDKTPDDFPPAVGRVNVAKPEPDAAWLRSAEGVALDMVRRVSAKLTAGAYAGLKVTDAYVVDGGKVEARGALSLSGVTVRWVYVPTDGSSTKERQIITTNAVRLIAARMQSRLS